MRSPLSQAQLGVYYACETSVSDEFNYQNPVLFDLPADADDSFFLCKELVPGYLEGITGVYQTPRGYYVDDVEVEEFDKAFPHKEKLRLPGQIF